jgi:hypothetical protein
VAAQKKKAWIDTAWPTAAYIPFVIIGPDVHPLSADIIRLEERERRLGRGHLHRYVLVLFVVVERALARACGRAGVASPGWEEKSRWGGEGGGAGNELLAERGSLRGLVLLLYLEKLFDYEGRFDGRDAACRDEKNVRVSFAPVSRCGKLSCHGNGKKVGYSKTVHRPGLRGMHVLLPDRTRPSSDLLIFYIYLHHLVWFVKMN